MLSKSRGQVLRVATVFHLLFHIDKAEEPLPLQISDAAMKAAVNFIQTACQHAAFIAGRGTIEEELQKFKSGTCCALAIHIFLCTVDPHISEHHGTGPSS